MTTESDGGVASTISRLSAGICANSEPPSGSPAPPTRLRLLLVSARYLPFVGGVELHVHEVARRLAARGVRVTILTTDPSGRLSRHETADGVAVRRVRAWPARRDYYFAPGIFREIARAHCDVVHVQGYQTLVAPIALLAARRRRLPTVLTFHAGGHSSPLRQAIRPAQLQALRPLIARADRLVALAPFEVSDYSRRLGIPRERFAVIPNGSDLPAAAAAGVVRDPLLIASLGRLERYKGHHRVLAAFPHVLARRPEARLWIGGQGPEEGALARLARELGVADRVEIRAVSAGDRAQMARELARVKTVVSLSEFETQPIAVLEALALGCRLVVADTPGLDALARAGYAVSLPLEAPPQTVATAVVEALDGAPVQEPPALPTWDACADELLRLYRSIGGQRPLA
jgi:glycosyltransferase involved in cell wall biosynthesis